MTVADGRRSIGWIGILRIGLVQASIGAVLVLVTSVLNRVMVVELRLAASIPGALIGLHYALQTLRPGWGHRSDGNGRRTPWIVGGMAVLAVGSALAVVAAATMATRPWSGAALSIAGFALIGIGVGAAGTALLTMLAEGVAPARRPVAAALVWIMMIVGFIVTSAAGAHWLAPFSFARLVRFGCAVSALAFLVSTLSILGVEPDHREATSPARQPGLAEAVRGVWADAEARRFTLFILVSMLAYSAQDLILEPFAGLAFGLPLSATAALTALQNGGVLVGMVGIAVAGRWLGGRSQAGMRRLALIGCGLSALALATVSVAGEAHLATLLRPAVAGLGLANGLFAVSAIGLMMALAAAERDAGVRMGVFGAAQAIAFGAGGLLGTLAVDAARLALGTAVPAYGAVFFAEAAMFLLAASLLREQRPATTPKAHGLEMAATA